MNTQRGKTSGNHGHRSIGGWIGGICAILLLLFTVIGAAVTAFAPVQTYTAQQYSVSSDKDGYTIDLGLTTGGPGQIRVTPDKMQPCVLLQQQKHITYRVRWTGTPLDFFLSLGRPPLVDALVVCT